MSDTAWWQADSPIGPLLLECSGGALTRLHFQDGPRPGRPSPGAVHSRAPFAAVLAQLEEYFAGTRQAFDLPLAPAGTGFQRATWRALCEIPYGTTHSYGEVARALGKPGAMRAVGQACGANPIAVIIPCHRVLAGGGAIGGFGGGLPIKRRLLALEARSLPLELTPLAG